MYCSYMYKWSLKFTLLLEPHGPCIYEHICLSFPSTWRDITSLADPTNLPPMKTAGTGGLHPSPHRARSISWPLKSLLSSWVTGLAPRSNKRDFMLWHMAHELLVKITTGFFNARSLTLSAIRVRWLKPQLSPGMILGF